MGGDLDDPGNLQRSLFHHFVERLAFDKFHRDERNACIRFTHVINNADVGMIEGRRRFRLDQESLATLGFRCQLGRQKLDRRLAFQSSVFGQEDFPHAACPQLGGNPIIADRCSDHA